MTGLLRQSNLQSTQLFHRLYSQSSFIASALPCVALGSMSIVAQEPSLFDVAGSLIPRPLGSP